MILLCTFLHLQIQFQMIVFVFPIFVVSVEKLHRPIIAMRIMLGVKMSFHLGRL